MASLPSNLTIRNFHNPGGSAMQTSILIRNYVARYDAYISKNIKLKAFRDGKSYVFLVRVPSEKNGKYKSTVFYDVILEFYPIHSVKNIEEDKKFVEYGMRLFSNCPTFMFMFTNVYHKMDSLYKKIPESMYSSKALTDAAKETNPYKLVGIEKSVWYALRKVWETTKYVKTKVDDIAETLPTDTGFKFPGNLFDDVLSQDEKLKEVQENELVKKPKKSTSSTQRGFIVNGRVVGVEDRKAGKKSNLGNIVESNLKNTSFGVNKLKENKLSGKTFGKNLKENKLKGSSTLTGKTFKSKLSK